MTSVTFPRPAPTEVVWDEITPSEHSVQIYPNRALFLDALEGYAAGGLRAGETVIVIATPLHRRALERRLRARGFDVDAAVAEARFIALDAEATLARFMVDGWPDEARFRQVVGDLLARARRDGGRARAFGEMVALLWRQGHNAATIRLEHLWNQICAEHDLCLFCAYPETAFTGDPEASISEICRHHTRVIAL